MGSPSPTSTYAISLPRTRRRFFWYGNAAEIMWPFPSFLAAEIMWPSPSFPSSRTSSARYATLWPSLVLLLLCRVTARTRRDSKPEGTADGGNVGAAGCGGSVWCCAPAPHRLETRPSSSSRPFAHTFAEADANDSPSAQILIPQSPAEGLPAIAVATALLRRDSRRGT